MSDINATCICAILTAIVVQLFFIAGSLREIAKIIKRDGEER